MKIRNVFCAAVSAALAASCLCACSFEMPFGTPSVSDADLSVGDAVIEEKVENLEIDWSSGTLTLETRPGNTVEIIETADQELPDSKRVHWALDGKTLRIYYSDPTATGLINLGGKDLTVYLPEDAPLTLLRVGAASAGVSVSDVTAKEADISTASGDVTANIAAEKISVSAASGDMDLTLQGDCESADFDASSGSIKVFAGSVGVLSADTSSGRVEVTADSVEKLRADTASGNLYLALNAAPKEGNIDTSSGSVTLLLPENSGFTLDIDTASGKINWDVPLKRQGDTFVSGDGSGSISIDTASGNVTIGKI